MKKKLPQIKKNLKSFILEEDAKVIDKSAIKIASFATAISLGVVSSVNDANAGLFDDHENHNNHSNKLNVDEDLGLNLHRGENPSETEVALVPPKSVITAHANHFNHTNDSGYSFLGIGGDLEDVRDEAGNVAYRVPENILRELDAENNDNPSASEANPGIPQPPGSGFNWDDFDWDDFDWEGERFFGGGSYIG